MIDLKRNSKKEPVKATGLRTRASSSYTPNQKQDFKISRGRFSNFLTCKRCFYLDRVKGLDPPGTCLLYTSPSPRDRQKSRMPSSA